MRTTFQAYLSQVQHGWHPGTARTYHNASRVDHRRSGQPAQLLRRLPAAQRQQPADQQPVGSHNHAPLAGVAVDGHIGDGQHGEGGQRNRRLWLGHDAADLGGGPAGGHGRHGTHAGGKDTVVVGGGPAPTGPGGQGAQEHCSRGTRGGSAGRMTPGVLDQRREPAGCQCSLFKTACAAPRVRSFLPTMLTCGAHQGVASHVYQAGRHQQRAHRR